MAVAYSGGRDSTALLHATLQVAGRHGMRVVALHVNHGLSRYADAWQQHGQAQCARWAARGWPIEFRAHRVRQRPPHGDSLEAWAREQRYAALRQMALAEGVDAVLLAQHQRDQAETFLLQALRGAGLAGLSGMPRMAQREGITWLRPWLSVSHEAIDRYVDEHCLTHVEDDSNGDTRLARNRVRHQVWPALSLAFAQAETTLADAATWAQQASDCLDDLAALDLAEAATASGLRLDVWLALSEARRSNALRAWIATQTEQVAPASLVTRLMAELTGQGSARWPCAGGELRRHRRHLKYVRVPTPTRASVAAARAMREESLSIRRCGTYRLPGWGGRLRIRRTPEAGVPLAWLAHLQLVVRSGGERFQSGIGRPARSLKKQFQAAGLPAWEREGPLLYSGGQLVFVPGLGLDARILALPGQPQVMIEWLADSP